MQVRKTLMPHRQSKSKSLRIEMSCFPPNRALDGHWDHQILIAMTKQLSRVGCCATLPRIQRLAAYVGTPDRDGDDDDDHRRGDQAEHACDAGLAQHESHDKTGEGRGYPAHRIDEARRPR